MLCAMPRFDAAFWNTLLTGHPADEFRSFQNLSWMEFAGVVCNLMALSLDVD